MLYVEISAKVFGGMKDKPYDGNFISNGGVENKIRAKRYSALHDYIIQTRPYLSKNHARIILSGIGRCARGVIAATKSCCLYLEDELEHQEIFIVRLEQS